MSLIIVTQNQYIIASKIYHVTLDEDVQEFDNYVNGKYRSIRIPCYTLNVLYIPETTGHNSSSSAMSCEVTIRGATNAHKVFSDLISQIREQMPDQLFLDKALERMLASVDENSLIERDEAIRGAYDDGSTKKVRRVRKAKRTGKAVLRKPKTSNRKRR